METSIDARFLQPLDLTIEVTETGGARRIRWPPDFRWSDTADVTPDPASQKLLAKFRQQLGRDLNQPIGRTEVRLDSRRGVVRGQESSAGN
ncbi:hypothetical protein U879_20815 [Defluviimonas sp. 20V17]|uniref:Uncharacterized protein n=1 Tax=Allgaiera indica TaxID=765699 RepID=A0AAN4US69_9RHOB|nr:hypothetical protein [Allgaiera indica]KDB01778.1 hypothetical protein U879_20815 [Defluviimonas sp. 20V17]GHE02543.1 hypothetical protein GCM10008024_22430 [Allgaiera indica]SDX28166.1 hypothetical protein SAMN05444006_11315 [Allgaiera indica]